MTAVVAGTTLGHTVHLPPAPPRAMVCAIHGMGMTGAYFSTHSDAAATLAAAATAAGFGVLIPDRPGYGASSHVPSAPLDDQAKAVEELIGEVRGDLPVVLVGHSLGGRVALEIAARGRIPVSGLEIAAAGYRIRDGVVPDRAAGRQEAWGPPSCYPPGTFALARSVVADVPPGEVVADAGWSPNFLRAAALVTCPFRIAWAVHDRWWRLDADEAAAVSAAFAQAPSVEVTTLLEAGHNLHLGVHARGHNDLTVDFVSRCLEEVSP